MKFQLSYSELQKIISKSLQKGIFISYVDEKTISIMIETCITLKARLKIEDIIDKELVVVNSFDGIENIAYRLSNISIFGKSVLKKVLKKYNLNDIITIDKSNHNRLTIHLEKIKQLEAFLNIFELNDIKFDVSNVMVSANYIEKQ